MASIRVTSSFVFFAAPDQWAGNPFLLRHSSGKLILGFRLNPLAPGLDRDWDNRLRPVFATGRTPEELAAAKPRFLADRPGPITPAFFELPGGALLAWHNEWAEFKHGTPEGSRALADPANAPYLNFHGKDPRLLGLDAPGVRDTFGVLQPIKVYRSDDIGLTWRPWGAIYGDNERKAGGCGFRGNMIGLAAQTVALALNDGRLVVSSDEGRSWQDRGRIGPAHNETFLYRKPGGELAAFVRGGETRTLHISTSADEGKTWSPTRDTGIQGANPFFALPHSSGNTLLLWGRRDAPRGVKAKVLRPDLSDLIEAPELWVDQYAEPTSSGGYPAAAELDDGSCLVVYYARSKPFGPCEIHGRRVVLTAD